MAIPEEPEAVGKIQRISRILPPVSHFSRKIKKKKEFTWTNEDEEIFQAVKNKFKGDQILGLFDFEERSHGTHRCIGLRYRCRNQSVRRQRKKETSFILFMKIEPSGGKIFNS